MEEKKSTPLGGRVWFSAVFFGLIGQIAWIVENMYFATFALGTIREQSGNMGLAEKSFFQEGL